MDLSNKAYIITGASGGLGKRVSKKLLEKGANLILSCRNKNKLEDIIQNYPNQVNIFTQDLKDNLFPFFLYINYHLNYLKQRNINLAGLFNAIGTPARVYLDSDNPKYQNKEIVMRESLKINYEIPIEVAKFFINKANSGNILFMSSQHTYYKTEGKETYLETKKKLEEDAITLAYTHPNLHINIILAGNLGLGMSEEAREKYKNEGSLVDENIILKKCLEFLTTKETAKKVLIVANNNKTEIKYL